MAVILDRLPLILEKLTNHRHSMIYACVATGICAAGYVTYKLISTPRRKYVDSIETKAVLVTGCDSGFGYTLAKQLSKLGCPVFAGCFTKDGADRLNSETCDDLKTIMLDMRSSESIQDAFTYVSNVIEKDGNKIILWGLVNNAGILGANGPTEFQTRADYRKLMEVNFLGHVDVINTFLPLLKQSKGRIVNISSLAARVPAPWYSGYVACKSAMWGFSESLRREKKVWGISVCTIFPGFHLTGISDMEAFALLKEKQWENLPKAIQEEYGEEFQQEFITNRANYLTNNASPNLYTVTDVLEEALFSVSPKANYIAGSDAKRNIFWENMSYTFMDKVFERSTNTLLPRCLKKAKSTVL